MVNDRLMNESKLNRLRKFDYSSSGYYFITICTKYMMKFFGEIKEREMILNEYGEIVKRCWEEIPEHYKNVSLDEYIVMPNHLHGIITINNGIHVGTGHCPVPTNNTNKIHKYGLLSKVMNSFKNVSTKLIRKTFHDFQWQRSYYDHIIRNEKSLHKIREYIRFNPSNKETEDNKHHIENIFT